MVENVYLWALMGICAAALAMMVRQIGHLSLAQQLRLNED